MTRRGVSTIETVRRCLTSALRLARTEGYKSLGVGAIGTGPAANAIDMHSWFRAFADVTVRDLHEAGCDSRLSVVLVLFEPTNFAADVKILRSAFRDAWGKLGCPSRGRPETSAEVTSTSGLAGS
jgi:O-acetyl-ADP-ribose deacetylase (regulator of RNase III)